jgi:hypothetical protein
MIGDIIGNYFRRSKTAARWNDWAIAVGMFCGITLSMGILMESPVLKFITSVLSFVWLAFMGLAFHHSTRSPPVFRPKSESDEAIVERTEGVTKEDWREVMRAYGETCQRRLERQRKFSAFLFDGMSVILLAGFAVFALASFGAGTREYLPPLLTIGVTLLAVSLAKIQYQKRVERLRRDIDGEFSER